MAFESCLENFVLANFKSAFGTKNTQCQQEQALKLNLSCTSLLPLTTPYNFPSFSTQVFKSKFHLLSVFSPETRTCCVYYVWCQRSNIYLEDWFLRMCSRIKKVFLESCNTNSPLVYVLESVGSFTWLCCNYVAALLIYWPSGFD